MSSFALIHPENVQHLFGISITEARGIDHLLQILAKQDETIFKIIKYMRSGDRSILSGCCGGRLVVQFNTLLGEHWSFKRESFPDPIFDPTHGGFNYAFQLISERKSGKDNFMCTLPSILVGATRVSRGFVVYCHAMLDANGRAIPEMIYIGVTKRGWRHRYREHQRAALNGSRYRFHEALRKAMSADKASFTHIVEATTDNEEQAMAIEEKLVADLSLYPKGLNMIPGGRAGIAYLAKIGAISRGERVSPDGRGEIVERFFQQTSRVGMPNPLIAALWNSDQYAERIICGAPGRLKPHQINEARYLSSLGKMPSEIASFVAAKNEAQVRRMLSGTTYGRIGTAS
jgi:hypothetical protein